MSDDLKDAPPPEVSPEMPVFPPRKSWRKERKANIAKKTAAIMAGEQPTKGVSPDMAALVAQMERQHAATLAELIATRKEQPQAQAAAFAKIQNPSNLVPTGRSAFNPRGDKLTEYQMPRLKCEIHAPWKIHPEYHGLDREEVELFNLLEAGEYTVTKVDDKPAKVIVQVLKNDVTGEVEKMRIQANWTEEEKNLYPSMRVMLREMIGPRAHAVMPMKEELRLIATGDLSVSV